jgi:hypothetical protein
MQYPSDWQKVENQNNVTLSLSQNGSLGSSEGNLSIESYPSVTIRSDEMSFSFFVYLPAIQVCCLYF